MRNYSSVPPCCPMSSWSNPHQVSVLLTNIQKKGGVFCRPRLANKRTTLGKGGGHCLREELSQRAPPRVWPMSITKKTPQTGHLAFSLSPMLLCFVYCGRGKGVARRGTCMGFRPRAACGLPLRFSTWALAHTRPGPARAWPSKKRRPQRSGQLPGEMGPAGRGKTNHSPEQLGHAGGPGPMGQYAGQQRHFRRGGRGYPIMAPWPGWSCDNNPPEMCDNQEQR